MILRPNPRQAWAALAWGLLFVVAFFGLAEAFLPARLDASSDPPYTARRDRLRQRWQSESPTAPLVVMLGSSRTSNALDGAVAEAELRQSLGANVCVANFGTPGCGPYHCLALLGRLLRDDVKPDLVIVEALPTYLLAHDWQWMTSPKWLPFHREDQAWLAERGVRVETENSGPAFYRYRTDILKLTLPRILSRPVDNNWIYDTDAWGAGLMASDLSARRREKGLAVARSEYEGALRNFQFGDTGIAGLRLILEECNRRQIRSLLVLMPEGPTFRTWYRPAARQEIEERLARLADECDSRLVVSSEWIAEEDFADSHHLLASGAAQFTARLSREALCEELHDTRRVAAAQADVRRR